MKAFYLLPILSLAVVAGCARYEPQAWVDRGSVDIAATGIGLIYCYEDANIIDGERIVGTLCGEPTSGFFSKGEPVVSFGPWGRKFMRTLVSDTTAGAQAEYEGKRVLLKCSVVTAPDGKTEVGRDCLVTMNEQRLVGAKFIFKKSE
ncbi:hypothetical protein D16iCDA_08775 [Pseudomonas seleniipraecipitans]|uniref:Lipoprotein n=1 Tax=Phytopseudomonas seleniipraecipitans TaxID=640205 RepID=A0ABY5JFU6_9GAMM|nr:hypothetical protein [Pseudomonas seleniipraecipitans]UUD65727.1 hypothetical protein D16iCDA_08775 [Pseudomonas seleniipraecipitans]